MALPGGISTLDLDLKGDPTPLQCWHVRSREEAEEKTGASVSQGQRPTPLLVPNRELWVVAWSPYCVELFFGGVVVVVTTTTWGARGRLVSEAAAAGARAHRLLTHGVRGVGDDNVEGVLVLFHELKAVAHVEGEL